MPPVDDQSRGVRDPIKSYRLVVAGDTLYSIAWEIGQDYRTLAGWNNIQAPYIIRKGQRLKIKPQGINKTSARYSSQHSKSASYHRVKAGDTLYSLARKAGVNAKQLASWNKIPPPYTIKPGQRLRMDRPAKKVKLAKSANRPDRRKKTTASKRKTSKIAGKIKSWSWPTKGRVSGRFGRNGKKGLEITGRKGQPIRAAAAGKVVYQGSGLRGYGQLVIIKHNQEFLSAYAHCDTIVVSEGDVIKKGQQIASMGKTGTNKVKLHFEIRYRGSPVNPEKYLRRR